MKLIPMIAMAMILASDAHAGCIVADPTAAPLNVRTSPHGRIISTLENGDPILILDTTIDRQGRTWVYVGNDQEGSIGWVYREYVVCKGETQR